MKFEKKNIDITCVSCLEDELLLITEGERDYQLNGAMNIKEAYVRGLDFINGLENNS